jgi:three-Cys-motif partner protein
MASSHQFGGQWTEEKLGRLKKYLSAYTTIFTGNARAATFTTTFVDAFAGTGYRNQAAVSKADAPSLFPEDNPLDDEDARSLQKGSAQIALEVNPPFDKYILIEKRPDYAQELERLRDRFPAKASYIRVVQGEANSTIQNLCRSTNWRSNRAVVFLDPYGMQVEWNTIAAIAQTQAIDLWLLFPLGQAVNRVLKRNAPPDGGWADRLTTFFGTSTWREAFYRPRQQLSLFDDNGSLEKVANFDQIGAFFVERLASVFAQVAENPLPLLNSNNVPIYLLCFAAANPKGAPTAVKIAQHVLRK